jgi:tetratricopeptide (TPR) repeat protein
MLLKQMMQNTLSTMVHKPPKKIFRTNLLMVSMLCICILPSVSAQKKCNNLLNKAIAALCKGDTIKSLQRLQQYETLCCSDTLLPFAYFMEAKIHKNNKKYDQSLAIYRKGLSLCVLPLVPLFSTKDLCPTILESTSESFLLRKRDFLFAISDLHHTKGDYHAAMHTLDSLKKRGAFEISGCANEMIRLESEVAFRYANCLFAIGDTTNGIHELLSYIWYQERDISAKITLRLKEILSYKYTKAQIAAEIDRGLSSPTVERITRPSGYSFEEVSYTLFGKTMCPLGLSLSSSYETLYYYKNLLSLKN